MCGIFAHIEEGDDINCEGFELLKHRGPEHTSSIRLKKFNYTIFLGFHRLAIIDPTEKSDSFLQDEEVYLVCNGEIYNYKELIEKYQLSPKTGSDCEVILQLYKNRSEEWPQILEELDGVFAFVLYDHRYGKILIARDRYGVRPLFVSEDGLIRFVYASEAKAINYDNVYPYQPSFYTEIMLDERSKFTKPWFSLDVPRLHTEYLTSKFIIEKLLRDAVRKRLCSDRPIGFLLSGGLDSSLIASIARRFPSLEEADRRQYLAKVRTFSIGLEGSPDLVASQKVADYLGTDHTQVIITPEEIVKAVPDVIYHNESYDITTIRASIPMFLLAKYIKQNTDIKVIMSGEGADELFGGYLYFHEAPSDRAFQKETQRLLKNLYHYDLLRGDRTTSAWGLELRVPFLDADLVSFVSGIDPRHKRGGIEKRILREAFSGYLPNEILFRQKEAFSDGVGYRSVAELKRYASTLPIDTEEINHHIVPHTDEGRWYYTLFKQWYSTKINIHPKQYWMPRWVKGVNDPSATVLKSHTLNTKN